uniref:uncharacterized protein LOC101291298 isoform X1 n=1 Tax=Fragaria vesca subsp. vesca TaxID=101020 RepID=UPI0005CB6E41|nr:PREDICTED: uncharacterized protein LOC101291298 isoform X1 [Fragaria vesca subsp. vesca]
MASQGDASSSGSVTPPYRHDVFLSFRGKDTRSGFTYHLYKALEREKIKTFFDDRTLKRGENISTALLQAIEVSRISVVICSENYGSSGWCLDELVRILECQKSKQQVVIPVFYKVDPAHVRHQIGSFGEALAGLKYNEDKVPKWRAALTQVANLSGWTYVNGYESDFIEKIVKEILDVGGVRNETDLNGLNYQENNKYWEDVYNPTLLHHQMNTVDSDVYNKTYLKLQKEMEEADVYNKTYNKLQKEIEEADVYNKTYNKLKKEIEEADVYNKTYDKLQKEMEEADVYNKTYNKLQREMEEADVYNKTLFRLQKETEEADVYNKTLLRLQKEAQDADVYNKTLLRLQKEINQ